MSELILLNCPFCGGEARLYGNTKPVGTRMKHYQVAVCTNDDCGCRTSPCETVEDAIYKWNTRTPMANIVEKLEELKKPPFIDTPYHTGFICGVNYSINIVKQVIKQEN